MADKKFYIFSQRSKGVVVDADGLEILELVNVFTGTLDDARDSIKGADYEDGTFRILEDTSGPVTKSTETVLTFETPEGRKRPRKAATAPE